MSAQSCVCTFITFISTIKNNMSHTLFLWHAHTYTRRFPVSLNALTISFIKYRDGVNALPAVETVKEEEKMKVIRRVCKPRFLNNPQK